MKSAEEQAQPRPRLFVAIPVFNEAANIPDLLQSLKGLAGEVAGGFETIIVVVDDGSRDGSADRIKESAGGLDIAILANEANRGPGFCFGRAFEHLRPKLSERDWVVTMEADNTSAIDTLLRMLVRKNEGYDVVLASPYTYGGGFVEVSPWRVLISHAGNALVKVCLNLRGLNTFSSFFRLYRGGILQRLYGNHGSRIIESPGFECMVELLYKLVLAGASISEVELRVDWSRRRGSSKMKIIRTVGGYLAVMSKRKRWKDEAAGRSGSKPGS